MAEETGAPFDRWRATGSHFTTTTSPSAPPSDMNRRGGFLSIPSLTPRRRKCLAISLFSLLAIFLLFRYFTGVAFERFRVTLPSPPPVGNSDNPQKCSPEPVQTLAATRVQAKVPEANESGSVMNHALEESITTASLQAPVVFLLIMWSKSSAREGALLIKSILMYNSRPSEFHIICDDTAEDYLRSRFKLVHRPRHDVFVKFYKPSWQSMLGRIEREGSITTDHSAGLPGLMKLFMHEIFPVKKGIYVDTDSFFIADPALMWDVFESLKPSTAVVMSSHPDQSSPEWNHASRICSCVMLLRLDKLRSERLMDSSLYHLNSRGRFPSAIGPEAFRAMYGLPGGDGRGRYNNVRLGDQGYWWAIVSHRPDLFEPLSYDFEVTSCLLNTYNIALGDDDVEAPLELSRQTYLTGTPQEGTVVLPKLLHFNCLHGTDVYMDWEGWTDSGDILNQRWGAAMRYHNGYKWIWLNSGRASLRMETTSVVFADEQYATGGDS